MQLRWSNIAMHHCHVILLFFPPPGEALRLLKKTRCQSGLILAETHPLQGELADATARAYASMGTDCCSGIFAYEPCA